jgi:hypothetical protein
MNCVRVYLLRNGCFLESPFLNSGYGEDILSGSLYQIPLEVNYKGSKLSNPSSFVTHIVECFKEETPKSRIVGSTEI